MRLHSLTSRFLLTLIVSTSLPFAIFGWFVLDGMRELVEGQIIKVYLPEKAENAAQEIAHRLDEIDQACAMAKIVAENDQLEGRGLEGIMELVEFTPGLLDSNVDLLLQVDASGNVLYHIFGNQLDPTSATRRDVLIPQRVTDAPWFEMLRNEEQPIGKVWLPWQRSDYLHRNPGHRSLDPADYNVGVAYRIEGHNGFGGALLVLVRCGEVQQILDSARNFLVEKAGLPSAQVFLMDEEGITIAHTDRAAYGALLEPLELREAMLRTEETGEMGFACPDGVQRMAGFAKLEARAVGQWWLGLQADRDELFATSGEFSRVLVLAIVVTMVILVFWSLIASRAILSPVHRLVAATKTVAQGDLDVRVPARGRHELADLGRAFNAMTEQLAASRDSLKEAERQAAWAEMARQVAHEIKNPLTPMRLSAQLLLKAKKENDPRVDELIDRVAKTVIEQTAALDRIASDFRHFAGAPERLEELLPADEFLEKMHLGLRTMAESQGISVRVAKSAPSTLVSVDQQEMQRVFLNLVANAAEAGGPDTRVELSAILVAGAVQFRVQDDGPGVPDSVRHQLFNPYFTTKSSGTGLGLAISRRVVEANGGAIHLESSGPGCTVFCISLPCADGAADVPE